MAKGTVLVCDDDELIIDLLQFKLQARDYDVLTARDGNEALRTLSRDAVTIVESINSLLALHYPDCEVIVINDGSKDKAAATSPSNTRRSPRPAGRR